MKSLLLAALLSAAAPFARAQTLGNFFYNTGVKDLATCAHPTNHFDHGTYDLEDGYVIIDMFYTENVHTRVRLDQGAGSLYFNRLRVLYDNDFVNPFVFFGMEAALLVDL